MAAEDVPQDTLVQGEVEEAGDDLLETERAWDSRRRVPWVQEGQRPVQAGTLN